jgi:hypothetical protein
MAAAPRAILRVATKVELRSALARLAANAGGISHAAWGPIACLETYTRNVKGYAGELLLPGFSPEALARDPAEALQSFHHFCRSQFGQRRHFVFYFGEIAPPQPPRLDEDKAPGRAQASFDGTRWGPGYLSFSEGARVTTCPPPSEPEGWAFGVLADSSAGWFPPSFVSSAA